MLKGDLRDEQFAARLRDVLEGTADPIYGDGRTFFQNTYPTDGLRTLAREVLGRLSGKAPSSSPFIRLETSFGGGKTHNLIALWHLAQGTRDAVPADLVNVTWIPTTPWLVAGVVGSDGDPANGITHTDGVVTWTIWGEIAWQLGSARGDAKAAYNVIRASDEQRVAPGTQVLEKLLGDGPVLVMLDEIGRYLRVAKAISAGENKGSNLAEQTVAFLMTLAEYASSRPRVSVVLTLADSKDAFAEETAKLVEALGEARRVSARQERVITPTGEGDIARIVRHRLFVTVDESAAQETAQAYAAHLAKVAEQGTDLPQHALRAEWAKDAESQYPFHPELLRALSLKTATIPNFQKTRGALRLLAQVVRRLWEAKPDDALLIHTHHLDVDVDAIASDLTSRLDRPAYRQVIDADIATGTGVHVSHCQAIDRRFVEAGKPAYARRAAINVLLHSLVQGVAAGVDPAELLLSVLQPGDEPLNLKRALALMLAEEKGDPGTACWYLHWDGHRYRFSTEPSLEKIIQEEATVVGRVAAKQELDRRIKQVWKKGALAPAWFPAEAADVPDDAREPKLAVVHYDAAKSTVGQNEPPELVAKLFATAGSAAGFRIYKNNVVFLVADTDQAARMVDVAQRYLAIARIAGSPERMAEFTDDNRKKLRGMLEAAELDVRVAITRAYRHLWYPSADAPAAANGLAHEVLPAQDQGDVANDQSSVVLRVLKQFDKTLSADDSTLAAAFVKARAWPVGAEKVTTEDLRREFAKRLGLKILLDVTQLKKTIRAGVEQGVWIYFDVAEGIGYGKVSPAPLVQLSEDAILYLPDSARSAGIPIKGEKKNPEPVAEEACPLCGNLPCTCGTGPGGGGDGKSEARQLLRFAESGPPAQVFQHIADRFADAKAGPVGRLVLGALGMGKDAVSDAVKLGLAIPQLGAGSVQVRHELTAELPSANGAEKFTATFNGGWERYKRVKQITDALAQEATSANVNIRVMLTYADGLSVSAPAFETLRDVLVSLGVGKLTVEVEERAPVAAPQDASSASGAPSTSGVKE